MYSKLVLNVEKKKGESWVLCKTAQIKVDGDKNVVDIVFDAIQKKIECNETMRLV